MAKSDIGVTCGIENKDAEKILLITNQPWLKFSTLKNIQAKLTRTKVVKILTKLLKEFQLIKLYINNLRRF